MTAPELSPTERATVERFDAAPDALGLREEVAEVVATHHADSSDEQKVNGEWTWGLNCDCGEFVPDAEINTHLADALLPLIEAREKAAGARAWSEGLRAGLMVTEFYVFPRNPYRADRIEARP